MDSKYEQDILAWRADMEKTLRSDYSWLSLAGLFWLSEGDNPIGSGGKNIVQLPERFPKNVGNIRLEYDEVWLTPGEDVQFRINDEESSNGKHLLHADITGNLDYAYLDDLRMMLVTRSGRAAIRIWDPQSTIRKEFKGRQWFDLDSDFRVNAEIVEYRPPKEVLIEDILGFQQKGAMHAQLHFAIDGQAMKLDAQRLDSGAYYVIFKDATAGNSTYNSGRYLVTERAAEKFVIIDFNRAYNPPCAFTHFATCPLPRPENMLDVEINAGEKFVSVAR